MTKVEQHYWNIIRIGIKGGPEYTPETLHRIFLDMNRDITPADYWRGGPTAWFKAATQEIRKYKAGPNPTWPAAHDH